MQKEIRKQERLLAKNLAKAAESRKKEVTIFEKEAKAQADFAELQKRKMELMQRIAEKIRQEEEAAERFRLEKEAEEEQLRLATLKKTELAHNDRIRARTAAEKLLSTKKLQAEAEAAAVRERETIRLTELERARRMAELQRTKKPTEAFTPEDNERLRRGPKAQDFAHTNLRIEGTKIDDAVLCDLETQEDEFRIPNVPKKIYPEEMIAKTRARATETFRQAVKGRAEERREEQERTNRITQNLAGLREAVKGTRNLLVFKDDKLTDIFADFMREEPQKLVKIDAESRQKVEVYWADFPARKAFLEDFWGHQASQNETKSVSFNYSVSEAGREGQSDRSSEEGAGEDSFEVPSRDFRRQRETSDEPLDINKFISEQEEFIRNLNLKNDYIREEIQNYEYSDEAGSAGEETPGVSAHNPRASDIQKTKKLPPPKPVARPPPQPKEKPQPVAVASVAKEERREQEEKPAKVSKESRKKETKSDRAPIPNLYAEYDEDEENESVNLSSEIKKAASSSGKVSRKKVAKLTEIAEIDEEEDSQGSHIFIKNEGHLGQSHRKAAYDSEESDSPSPPPKQQKESKGAKDSAFLKKILQGYDLSESEEEGSRDTPTFQPIQAGPKRNLNVLSAKTDQKGSAGAALPDEAEGQNSKAAKSDPKDKEEMKRLRAKRMAYKPAKPEPKPAKKAEATDKPKK